MKKIAKELFVARDKLFKPPKKTELMLRFELAVELWGNPHCGFQDRLNISGFPITRMQAKTRLGSSIFGSLSSKWWTVQVL